MRIIAKKLNRQILQLAAALVYIIFSITFLSSCIRIAELNFSGSGNVISENRNILGVNSVSISAGMNLYITQGDTESLRIDAEDNILPHIVTNVVDGNLIIRFDNIFFGVANKKPINIFLNIKDLNQVNASSGASVTCQNLNTESLLINLGSGAVGKLIVDVDDLFVKLSSGARLDISGNTENQEVKLGSAGNYMAKNLISRTAVVDLSSGAQAQINVIEKLDADVSSGASLKYIGTPEVISNISSGGLLENISE